MNIRVFTTKEWDLVYFAALYTQGKKPTKISPSAEWKRKTVTAQHSVLRQLEFCVIIEDVPNFVHNHLVRHVHAQPYIRTMREDLTGVPNDEITRNTPNDGVYIINAQEMIHISNQRLCYKAAKETREVWETVIDELAKIEPELAKMCVSSCISVGFCKEYNTCGAYRKWEDNKREDYLKFVNNK